MKHQLDFPERRETDFDTVERPLSVSHLVRTLGAYTPVIAISLLSVAIGYAVIAILLYLLSPTQRTTVQPFRLEFRGATEGNLPNGVRFSATEIISTPILLKVFETDELKRFTTFGDFSRSIFVLEANREYEKLITEYQARLSDSRLSPLDRERIQKEFEAKRDSINKNDFSLSYARTSTSANVPESLARRVLIDILNTWAAFAINEQHALDYRVSVLSPQILDQTEIGGSDPIVGIEILRSKIYRVIENIDHINELPAAELMKTSDRMSLAEIRMRLEDIVRFRLEPLVGVARASGMVTNPPLTIHFLENQLAYDQRRLQAARAQVDSVREALLMYTNEPARGGDANGVASALRNSGATKSGEGETVMPQINDSFLERLMSLSKQATDPQYRQKVIQRYQDAIAATIPLEQAVSYQQQVLDQMKSGAVSSAPREDEKTVRAEIDGATAEVRRLIVKINEIYQLLSRNLNPSTQLFSVVGPPNTRIERARTLSRLALFGILILLIALPIIVLLCLLHNRVREEEAALVTRPAAPESA
jgi:hypothetical protein